jgi:hypothetical protein
MSSNPLLIRADRLIAVAQAGWQMALTFTDAVANRSFNTNLNVDITKTVGGGAPPVSIPVAYNFSEGVSKTDPDMPLIKAVSFCAESRAWSVEYIYLEYFKIKIVCISIIER